MKTYMLDVTGCKKEQLGGYDKPIPCELDAESTGLVVIAERIDPVIIKVWREQSRARIKAANPGLPPLVLEQAPVGFTLETLPIGAAITVVEE